MGSACAAVVAASASARAERDLCMGVPPRVDPRYHAADRRGRTPGFGGRQRRFVAVGRIPSQRRPPDGRLPRLRGFATRTGHLPMNFRRHILGAAGLLAATTAALAQQPEARARVPLFDAAAINQRCDGELAAARAQIAKMEKDKTAARLLPDFNTFE